MSETPANQFGISTDLPSVCECPPLCLHLFSAVCSFVFCQLDAALSLSLSLASPGKQQWPKKVWLQIRLGVTWILLPLRLSLNGQKLFLSLIDIVYNQKGNCTDWQVSDLTFSGFDLTIGAEVFACGEINWSLSNESLSVTSNFEAQLMACPPPPKKNNTDRGRVIYSGGNWMVHAQQNTHVHSSLHKIQIHSQTTRIHRGTQSAVQTTEHQPIRCHSTASNKTVCVCVSVSDCVSALGWYWAECVIINNCRLQQTLFRVIYHDYRLIMMNTVNIARKKSTCPPLHRLSLFTFSSLTFLPCLCPSRLVARHLSLRLCLINQTM